MIGFRAPKHSRRPIYSVTGEKLCYVRQGPNGDEIFNLKGRKIANVKKWKEKLKDLSATANAAGGTIISPDEPFES